MTTRLLLIVVILALGTGIVGGLLGITLLAPGQDPALEEDLGALTNRVDALESRGEAFSSQVSDLKSRSEGLAAQMDDLEAGLAALKDEFASLKSGERAALTGESDVTPQGVPIRLAYIDISALLDEIFLPVTQALEVKQQDLQDLRARYDQGQIDQRTYQQELLNLEVELLSVPLCWDLSLIQKMISSPEFSDLRATLVELGGKVQPLERELQALRHSAVQEVEDLQDFLLRYKQLQSLFEQLDQLLSQTVASVLTKVTQEIARAQGYALVLRKEDALYLDDSQLEDLAGLVKSRLPELFSP